jgi:hypothetical protein
MKITKELAQFLADEGVLTQFVYNHIFQYGKDHTFIIRGVSPAFTWRKTPEGHNYWLRLHYKYKPYPHEDN